MKESKTYVNHKDTVFCLLYKDKNNLLDLYNGMNGTSYTDTEGLMVTTLKNGIYVKYKNDASFVFGQDLYMFEQQSTKNPNMPLRYLHYLSDVYRGMYSNKDLYRSGLKIPSPHFITFYNGTAKAPEVEYLRLSDMFEKKDKETGIGCGEGESGVGSETKPINAIDSLELIVQVLNINSGNNSGLLEKCKSLKDYMTFVNKVRHKKNVEKKDIETAVNEAIDECIQENVLSDFFRKNRSEVVGVSIYEYDEEGHMEILKEEQYQRGVADGIEKGIEKGIKQGIQQGINEGIKEGQQKERVRAITSMLELGIDKEKILTKYSKEEYEMAVKEMEKQ